MRDLLTENCIDKLITLAVGIGVVGIAGASSGAAGAIGAAGMAVTGVSGLGAIAAARLLKTKAYEDQEAKAVFEAVARQTNSLWLKSGAENVEAARQVAELLNNGIDELEFPITKVRALAEAAGRSNGIYSTLADSLLLEIKDPWGWLKKEPYREIAHDVLLEAVRAGVLASATLRDETILAIADTTVYLSRTTLHELQDLKQESAAGHAVTQAELSAIRQLLSTAESSGAFDRAKAAGIPESAVRIIVERLGGRGVSKEDLPVWLDDWINATIARIEELEGTVLRSANLEDQVAATLSRSEQMLRSDPINSARPIEAEIARRKEARLERAEKEKAETELLYDGAIRIHTANLKIDTAVELTMTLANELGHEDARALATFIELRAKSALDFGSLKGNNPSLLLALELFRWLLHRYEDSHSLINLGGTYHCIGHALLALGSREADSDRLIDAQAAYNEALIHYNPEVSPDMCAIVNGGLGLVELQLGRRNVGSDHFQKSIAYQKKALKSTSRGVNPIEWARVNINLAIALREFYDPDKPLDRLFEALNVYTSALEVLTQEEAPHLWAEAQSGLGLVYLALGFAAKDQSHLEAAASCFLQVLEVETREVAPLEWARNQHNLGNSEFQLAQITANPSHLQNSISFLKNALEERNRQRVPLEWARTYMSLGKAYFELGATTNCPVNLQQAVNAFELALEVQSEANIPKEWAHTIMTLGMTRFKIATLEVNLELATAAMQDMNNALVFWQRNHNADQLAVCFYNIGNANSWIGDQRSDAVFWTDAAKAYAAAAKHYSREKDQELWASAHNLSGKLFLKTGQSENLEQALSSFEATLSVEDDSKKLTPVVAEKYYNLALTHYLLVANSLPVGSLTEAEQAILKILQECNKDFNDVSLSGTHSLHGSIHLALFDPINGSEILIAAATAFGLALSDQLKSTSPVMWFQTKILSLGGEIMLADYLTDRNIAVLALETFEQLEPEVQSLNNVEIEKLHQTISSEAVQLVARLQDKAKLLNSQ
jgi:tetratricopeptide (TPR) repeat protein